MSGPVKCLNCGSPMEKQHYKTRIMWGCNQCRSNFAPVESFVEILLDHEFRRFKSEIAKGGVKSSKNCPCCSSRMLLIIDLAKKNPVEVCAACRLAWLDPNEGLKIKTEQELNVKPAQNRAPSSYDVEPDRGFLFNLYLGRGAFGKKHPVLAGLLAIVLATAVITLFVWLIKDMPRGPYRGYYYRRWWR